MLYIANLILENILLPNLPNKQKNKAKQTLSASTTSFPDLPSLLSSSLINIKKDLREKMSLLLTRFFALDYVPIGPDR